MAKKNPLEKYTIKELLADVAAIRDAGDEDEKAISDNMLL